MLLEVKKLCKTYHSGFFNKRVVKAVKGISFTMEEGDVFGIIGESGSGKTTAARMIAGLIKPDSGSIFYQGADLIKANKKEWHNYRKEIQVLFQHPQLTFHPRKNLYFACAEPIRLYQLAKNMDEKTMVKHMMQRVGISEDQLIKFPHEISGGQAQRIAIARSLCLNPRLFICDEPTSMLDVSVQAQILQLLKEAKEKRKLSMVYISHDLDVIQAVCNHVAVMRQGEIIETGTTEEVFENPQHSYTKRLLSSSLTV